MDPRHTGEVLRHLEKQNELLMDAYRSMSHELHKLQKEDAKDIPNVTENGDDRAFLCQTDDKEQKKWQNFVSFSLLGLVFVRKPVRELYGLWYLNLFVEGLPRQVIEVVLNGIGYRGSGSEGVMQRKLGGL